MFCIICLSIYATTVKSFLALHPTSVLSVHPDWVQGHPDNMRKGITVLEYICILND
jgi:hypothetical protein